MILNENDLEVLSLALLMGYTGRFIRYVNRNDVKDIKNVIKQCAIYLIRSGDNNFIEFNKSIKNISLWYKMEINEYDVNWK